VNKKFLGEETLTCETYRAWKEEIRQSLVTDYFVGTEAYRVATKKKDSLFVWPPGMTPLAVRSAVDEACSDPEFSKASIRDALYLVNIELSVKHAKPPK
jgi:hypothetical protein